MSVPAIAVWGLSKRYRLGAQRAPYRTFRDLLAGAARRPVQILGALGRRRGEPEGHPDYVWALRDVSFEAQPGEVVGIIGRNGSGKSTLLKVLSRITDPTEGDATLHGRVGSLLEVGTGFHPELSGRENIYLNGALLGMRRSEISRQFDAIVSFTEVEPFLDTPVKFYSTGMYMRLAFAVAAHLQSEILIVDEVLAVGDAAFQRKCLDQMRAVAGQGRTVLFVSHNMAAVSNLCHSTLVLEAGRAIFRGPVEQGLQHYCRSNEARALGANLDGVPRHGAGGVRVTRIQLFAQGRESLTCRSGEPVELRFHYEVTDGSRPVDLSIQVRFLDDFGTTIFTLWNKVVDERRRVYPRIGWFSYSLDSLPLRPGVYPLTMWIKSIRGVEDWVERAVTIEVEEGDFFGTGRQSPQDAGPVLVPHRFHVEGAGLGCYSQPLKAEESDLESDEVTAA